MLVPVGRAHQPAILQRRYQPVLEAVACGVRTIVLITPLRVQTSRSLAPTVAIHADEEARQGEVAHPRRLGPRAVTSQMPVDRWHHIIGEPTIAHAIPDRIVHNAHRLKLKGKSLCRKLASPTQPA